MRHATKCPCVECFDVKVQRVSRWLQRAAVVIWAAVAALMLHVVREIDALPPVPLSAQQPETPSE